MPGARLPQVLIVTGAMAAGKSTVLEPLAERLETSVHLRGDVFRRMIVSGRLNPTPDDVDAWRAQTRLRYELSWTAADRYAREGFNVIYQDMLGDALPDALRALAEWRPGVVMLCPSPASLAVREAGRAKTGYKDGWTPRDLDAVLRAETPKVGLWLGTSAMAVAETVDAIVANPTATRKGIAGMSEREPFARHRPRRDAPARTSPLGCRTSNPRAHRMGQRRCPSRGLPASTSGRSHQQSWVESGKCDSTVQLAVSATYCTLTGARDNRTPKPATSRRSAHAGHLLT